MGVLNYGGTDYLFGDRLLAHLQVVITTKLRRRESFALSWVPDGDGGRGDSLLNPPPEGSRMDVFVLNKVPSIGWVGFVAAIGLAAV